MLTLIIEYGTYAGDNWIRKDIGLLNISAEQISEYNRQLTRTMLSIRLVKDTEDVSDIQEIWCGNYIPGYIEHLKTTEDRSITWPGYPNPATRIKISHVTQTNLKE